MTENNYMHIYMNTYTDNFLAIMFLPVMLPTALLAAAILCQMMMLHQAQELSHDAANVLGSVKQYMHASSPLLLPQLAHGLLYQSYVL